MKLTLKRWVRLLELVLAVALLALSGIYLSRTLSGAAAVEGSAAALRYQPVPKDLDSFLKLSVTDLNTAYREELMALPRIGEVLSERILAYRAEHGPFSCWEELSEVKGIGPKTMEALRIEAFIEPRG